MLRLLAQREQGYDDIAALTGTGVEDVRAKVKRTVAELDRAPSQDQKAMLRLLAQREEGYDDIAALTGTSVEDVRRKVREAVAELDAPGAGRADPERVEPAPPSAAEPAPPTDAEPAPEAAA